MVKSKPAFLYVAIAVLCAFALLLASCGGPQKSSSQRAEQPKTEPKAAASGSSEDTMRVGEDGVGYVTVPSSWTEFNDVDNPEATQYCADDKTIVTMQSYADQKGELTPKQAATNIYANMEDEDVEGLTGATVTLADQEAYQVYGYYADDDIFLVAWLLEDSDGVVHYVSAEGTQDTVSEAVAVVESSYSFTK
jgi:hypothetical protein